MSLSSACRDNLGLKALALLLALLLWSVATFGIEDEVTVVLPVLGRNLAPGLALGGRSPAVVEARIAGPKVLLGRLNRDRLAVNLDLRGVGEGSVVFTELGRSITLVRGLRITRLTPAAVELQVVRKSIGQP